MRRLFAFGILYLCAGIAAPAWAQSVGLFEPLEPTRFSRQITDPDSTIIRNRPVRIVTAELPRADWLPGDWVTLNFFDDVQFVVELIDVVKRNDTDYTWHGRLANDHGDMHMTVKGDVVVANVRGEEKGSFQIRMAGDGTHEVREIDESRFPECATAPENFKNFAPDPIRSVGSRDTGNVIDVMVVYTPAARVGAGGTVAMEALIDLAIAESNTAYANSLINSELRLVHQQEIAYTEVNSSTDLNNLTGLADGFMDGVHALRDTHGADNVSLFLDIAGSCGRAWVMQTLSTGFASSAFSVVDYSCATGNYSFAHELAHNWGSNHDRPNTSLTGVFPYSFGHNFFGNGGFQYRTIMGSTSGGGSRIQHFSNPLVTFDSVATGIDEALPNSADNAKSINNATSTIINWRQTVNTLTASPPSGFVTIGGAGGPFSPACKTYTLTNVGSSSIDWTASSNQGWVFVSSNGGTLGVGASVNVNACVSSTANAFGEGQHLATVTFTNTTDGVSDQRGVQLTVTPSQIALFTFDSDPGWTTQGDWAFGVPLGGGSNGGDPTSGFTGNNVYGYNLAGDYADSLPETNLTSSAINCSGFQNVSLTFFRWLGVETSQWDHAKVQVSNNGSTWTDVWVHNGGSFNDATWVQQTFDISNVADAQSTVFIRWVMGSTDPADTYPGWNIDDVLITGSLIASSEVWVDFAHGGSQQGSQSLPFQTLQAATSAVASDGVIKIKGNTGDNTSGESFTINKAMTIQAVNGTVRIGTP